MRLTQLANQRIKDNIRVIPRLALEMGKSPYTVARWIKDDEDGKADNGPLTTATAIKVIQEETGLSQEEILEEESITATKE